MRSSILTMCAFFIFAYSETVYCQADCFLITKQQEIPIYNEYTHQNVTAYVLNDTITEDYFIGVIYKIKKGYAYIIGSYTSDKNDYIKGWIEIKHVGTNIISDDQIPLYCYPTICSKKIYLKTPEWYPMEILKCHGSWLYVKYVDKYQCVSGWLHKKYQCSNPYTTCN